MSYGYNGKILHVNLTTGTQEIETPPEMFYRKYLGGSAMGMFYILREMPRKCDDRHAGRHYWRLDLRPEPGECQRPLADEWGYRRLSGRWFLPC